MFICRMIWVMVCLGFIDSTLILLFEENMPCSFTVFTQDVGSLIHF